MAYERNGEKVRMRVRVKNFKGIIFRFMNEIEIILYCDFHGHSRKQNVFIYGCENKHLPNERFKERIFPAMLAKNDPTKVCYDFKKMLIHSNLFL